MADTITNAEEGAEALFQALLIAYAESADDETLPFRDLLVEMGRRCGVTLEVGMIMRLEEEITLGEFRRLVRGARADLAQGRAV